MCTDKFRNTGIAMHYMPWGVHYVDKATLMEDIGCTKICDESQRQVCAILNAFGNAGKKIKGNGGIKGSKLCKDKKRHHCSRGTY